VILLFRIKLIVSLALFAWRTGRPLVRALKARRA